MFPFKHANIDKKMLFLWEMYHKSIIMSNSEKYNWHYCSLGGVTRVKIESGEDIAHLGELDKKLWTVLSCPVKGLEFDARTLAIIDSDSDGKVRIPEIVAKAQWLTSVLKDKDSILSGDSSIDIQGFNKENTDGAFLAEAAEKMLSRLGESTTSIDFDQIARFRTLGTLTQELSEEDKKKIYPYGENTAAALAACEAVNAKISDFFLRCKLIAFDQDAAPVLDVQVGEIGAISAGDLNANISAIANYPIARPNKECVLSVDGINPAWKASFDAMRSLVLTPEQTTLTESSWNAIIASFAPFKEYTAAQADNSEEVKIADALDDFLHLYRDFYKLLRNFVTFYDFYSPNPEQAAIFQAGKLYIDQRCCRLCVKVSDMGAHADMAGLSGMFLLYCSCTSKTSGEKMDIVAVMTEGNTTRLRPGKNAIFYDREGNVWDATITKIVDNPINVRQAFFAPYRKFWNFCVGLLNKSAADKDSKMLADMQQTAQEKIASPKDAPKTKTFDIAKFAGIFAAIGMAIGFIGQAIVAVATGIAKLKLWQLLVIIFIIMLLISGPSCFIAWTKLRKRNLGPVLNANGWAINSVVIVNVLFGATLTSTAKYPHLRLEDPYKIVVPLWKRILCWFILAALVAGSFLYFTNRLESIGLPYQKGQMKEALQSFSEDFTEDLQSAVDAGSAAADSVAVKQTEAAK